MSGHLGDQALLAAELSELELARQQIADVEERVDRQRAAVCALEDAGRPSETAAAQLESMEETLERFQHHARLIEQEIAHSTSRSGRERLHALPAEAF